jgi:uncharacterized protein
MKLCEYTIVIPCENKSILINGVSGAVDVIDNRIAEYLIDNRLHLLHEDVIKILLKRKHILEDDDSNKNNVFLFVKILKEKWSNRHNFLFIPTYDCNLRCSYCFEEPIRKINSNKVITEGMVDKAFEFISALVTNDSFRPCITFYGGEPFLINNYNIIKYIIDKGNLLHCSFSAITNGTNLDKYFDLINNNDFRELQITIDGYKESNDRNRPFFEKKISTFYSIINSLDIVMPRLNEAVTINIRINVDRKNIDDCKYLITYFKEKGYLKYKNFNYYYAPVSRRNNEQKQPDNTLSSNELLDAFCELENITAAGVFDRNIMLEFLNIFKNGGLPFFKYTYCGANIGSYIFDPNDFIYNCWDNVGNIKYTIGNYFPDIVLNQERLKIWNERTVLSMPKCIDCKYLFFCGGGCQKSAYFINNDYYNPVCNNFQEMFNLSVKYAYRQVQREYE